jgi:3-phenylpropionate/trans-cinnamate dioxygenase ferredoxin reductase subunit
MKRVAVVGASLAGLRAAEALRAKGYDGNLLIIGAEPHRPYDRPPLSKGFLLGTTRAEDLALAEPAEELGLNADWRLGVRAQRLDTRAGALTLSDGRTEAVDGVVIATGGRPRTLPGTEGITGVVTLRGLDDAVALRAQLATEPEHVVVIGAGFLGAEVAASARTLGREVTVVEAMPVPLAGAVGPYLGGICGQLHGDHGVRLILGHGVAGLDTVIEPGRRQVCAVRLDDGRALPAELVVVAVGMRPSTGWLAGSGLAVDDGVRTDAGWVTALPNVVAVGDVARHRCGGKFVRHEHWTSAAKAPATAVANLLAGRHLGHCAGGGYFWSDQYGVRIQFAGSVAPTDDVRVIEGAPEDRAFLATCHRDGVTTGVLAMNMARAFTRARRTLAVTATEEDQRCPTCSPSPDCSSTEPGATPREASAIGSSIPSTSA